MKVFSKVALVIAVLLSFSPLGAQESEYADPPVLSEAELELVGDWETYLGIPGNSEFIAVMSLGYLLDYQSGSSFDQLNEYGWWYVDEDSGFLVISNS